MATYKAGQILTADDLNQSALGAVSATASASLTVTTTATDIAGATVNITTTAANAVAFVTGIFDLQNTGADTFVGMLDVDGAIQAGQAISSGAGRNTVAQTWVVTLATAGAHTLKLVGSKVGAASVVTCNSTHTKITALVPGI